MPLTNAEKKQIALQVLKEAEAVAYRLEFTASSMRRTGNPQRADQLAEELAKQLALQKDVEDEIKKLGASKK